MYSFQFTEIEFSNDYDFTQNTYLWVWHANKIPPHIGISTQDAYFSLKVSGKDVGLPCDRTLNRVLAKNSSLLLIEVKVDICISDIKSAYKNYHSAVPLVSTCLTPIAEILELNDVNQLSGLLHKLSKNNTLGKVFGINLPEGYKSLPEYSPNDIQLRLKNLINAERKTNIS